MSVEKEYKWRANDGEDFNKMLSAVRACFKGRLAGPFALAIEDVYLDTPGREFSAGKIAFRLRCLNGAYEATFKSRTKMINGKAVRREETIPLPGACSVADALEILTQKPLPVPFSVSRAGVIFTLKNNRMVYRLWAPAAEYELALDDYCILVNEASYPMKEIELELKKGNEADFAALAQVLGKCSGLRAPEKSKVETAHDLLSKRGKQ